MSRVAYLLDASIYIFRAYFSLPERWHSNEGYPLNAVYGYTSFLLDLMTELTREGPVTLAVAFDESLGTCYRNDLYPGYKASRELPDEALAFQLEACRQVTECLRLSCHGSEWHEADDYIASFSSLARRARASVTIISRDKDLGQLLAHPADRLWDYAAGQFLDRTGFEEKCGVRPEQFADYLGLVGDAIDDIPGVPGIGPKSGAALVQAFNDLEGLQRNLDGIAELGLRGSARVRKLVEEHWQQALISRELARLDHGIEALELPAPQQLEAQALLELADYLESIGLQGGVLNRARHLAAAGGS